MKDRTGSRSKRSFQEALKSLRVVIAGANKVVPGIVVVAAALLVFVVWTLSHFAAMRMAIVVFVVVLLAVVVYGSTWSYGESALALVAGLLTAFVVEWDTPRFVVFMTACGAFTMFALMMTSVRLAADVEAIYRQAALTLAPDPSHFEDIEKALREVGESPSIDTLGPRERANVLRVFAFRKIPTRLMAAGLRTAGQLAVITKVDHEEIAWFVADVYRTFKVTDVVSAMRLLDQVYETMRDSPVAPTDFVSSFRAGAKAALQHGLEGERFLDLLAQALGAGVVNTEMYQFIQDRVRLVS